MDSVGWRAGHKVVIHECDDGLLKGVRYVAGYPIKACFGQGTVSTRVRSPL